MQMCYKLDQQKLFSNGKRATKYEANIEMDYPKGFNDKPILLQAKTKAALAKKSLVEKRISQWREKPQHGAFLRQLEAVSADLKLSTQSASLEIVLSASNLAGYHVLHCQ